MFMNQNDADDKIYVCQNFKTVLIFKLYHIEISQTRVKQCILRWGCSMLLCSRYESPQQDLHSESLQIQIFTFQGPVVQN